MRASRASIERHDGGQTESDRDQRQTCRNACNLIEEIARNVADIGPVVIPDHFEGEQVLFLSDILPTGWMSAVNADIEPGDTVAV